MLFYQKRSVPFDGLFSLTGPYLRPRQFFQPVVNRQQFYAGRPPSHTQFALGNFSFCQDSRFDWHLCEMGGWEYEDKTLALLWESEGVGIAAKTRMAHGLEIQVEKLNEVGGGVGS